MARKPGSGKCVHCLKETSKRNWDHVFPRSWYPDTTPNNIDKWKIPSCKPCNDKYGRLEEELGHLLSFVIDPRRKEARGIYKRMVRAYQPKYAKNDKDRRMREKKQAKLLTMIVRGDKIPTKGIYPGLEERWNRPPSERIAFKIPEKFIARIAEKIVRGITYIESGKFIGPDYEIQHYVVKPSDAIEYEQSLAKYGQILTRGPGLKLHRAVTAEDELSSINKITIWGEFIIYVSVLSI